MVIFHIYVKLPEGKTTPNISFGRCLSLSNSTCLVAMFRSTIVTYRTVRWRSLLAKSPCLGASTLQLVLVLNAILVGEINFVHFIMDIYIYIYIYMVTDRIMEKKNVQLRQAAPASDFFHNWIFPHKGSKYPGSDPNLFFSIILEVAIISICSDV